MDRNVRLLICGDVRGQVKKLINRLNQVQAGHGGFAALICVGQFFPSDSSGLAEFKEYFEGRKAIPLPIYFTGNYGEGVGLLGNFDQAGLLANQIPICNNLVWLKGSGILDIKGLRIAYLGGKYNPAVYRDATAAAAAGAYHEDDVDALRALADDAAVTDFFVSNEWPRGVVLGSDDIPAKLNLLTGTATCAELAADLKPRYQVAGTEEIFYCKEPYSSKGHPFYSRFIGLGSVGNTEKQRFLHALSVVPAIFLQKDDQDRPQNLKVSPYELAASDLVESGKLSRSRPEEGVVNWRFQVPSSNKRLKTSTEGSEYRVCVEFVTKGVCSREGNCKFSHELPDRTPIPKGFCLDLLMKGKCERGADCNYRHAAQDLDLQNSGGMCYSFLKTGTCENGPMCRFSHSVQRLPRASESPAPCWFCLSSPDVKTHLVVSVGEHFYCALAKGQIMPGHVLVLPVEHIPSLISFPPSTLLEIEKFKEALRALYESQGNKMIAFERYTESRAKTHAHLQVFPLSPKEALGAREAFEVAAEGEGFGFEEILPGKTHDEIYQTLKEVVKEQNYFLVELPDKTILVHPFKAREKMNMVFGRQVVAGLVGKPERADWKTCTVSTQEEKSLTDVFREQYSSFDLTN